MKSDSDPSLRIGINLNASLPQRLKPDILWGLPQA